MCWECYSKYEINNFSPCTVLSVFEVFFHGSGFFADLDPDSEIKFDLDPAKKSGSETKNKTSLDKLGIKNFRIFLHSKKLWTTGILAR